MGARVVVRSPVMPGTLAIIGAGFLGREVARGWEGPVIATTRSGARPEGLPASVSVAPLDLTNPHPLATGPLRAATHLLVCVAAGRAQDKRAVYVEGTRRLLDAVANVPWRRIVFVSSTSALPEIDGWIHEDCEAMPQSDRGRVQREAEAEVETWARDRGVPWLVLRLGGLYGPGRDLGAIYRQREVEPLPGDGHVPTNLIHVDDACAASLAALRAEASVTGIVHVVDDDHTPRRAMYDAIALARSLPPVTWADTVPSGAAPHGKRVSNLRLKSALGVRLLHPTHCRPDPCAVVARD